MPKPRKDEDKQHFIRRCMSDEESKRDFPRIPQRYAFCQSQWRRYGDKRRSATANLIGFIFFIVIYYLFN